MPQSVQEISDLEKRVKTLREKHPGHCGEGYNTSRDVFPNLLKSLECSLESSYRKEKKVIEESVDFAEFLDHIQETYKSVEGVGMIITRCTNKYFHSPERINFLKAMPKLKSQLGTKGVIDVLSKYDEKHVNEKDENIKSVRYNIKKDLIASIIKATIYHSEIINDILSIAKRLQDADQIRVQRNIFSGLSDSNPLCLAEVLETIKLYQGTIEEGRIALKFARICSGNAEDNNGRLLTYQSQTLLSKRVARLFQENAESLQQSYGKDSEELSLVQELLFSVARDTFFNRPNEWLIQSMTSFVLNPNTIIEIKAKQGRLYNQFDKMFSAFTGSNAGIHVTDRPEEISQLAYRIMAK